MANDRSILPRRCSISWTAEHTVWEFPRDRFVEYGPEDEAWARPLGFGREVVVSEVVTIPDAVIRSWSMETDGLAVCVRFAAVSGDIFR